MGVVFADQSGTTYGGLGTSHWNASVPAGTALGDLLVHAMATREGTSLVSADMPGWTQLGLFGGAYVIAVKYAEAFDVGGWAGELCTGFNLGGGGATMFPASITGCYRGTHDYAGVVELQTPAGTTHTVPAVDAPTADTTIIAFGRTMPPGAGSDVPEIGSIPGFTFRGHYQGFAFGQWWTNGIELHDKRAGAAGPVGPWTSTETGTDAKAWAVLGLVPRAIPRGIVTLPYFIPLGNT